MSAVGRPASAEWQRPALGRWWTFTLRGKRTKSRPASLAVNARLKSKTGRPALRSLTPLQRIERQMGSRKQAHRVAVRHHVNGLGQQDVLIASP